MLAFVFPGKMTAVPDIGPALAAVGFAGAGFEAEEFALGVQVGGGGVVEEEAEVEEVFLGGGALFEGGERPFGDEFLRGEGGFHCGRVLFDDCGIF